MFLSIVLTFCSVGSANLVVSANGQNLHETRHRNVIAQSGKSDVAPDELYKKAWRIVGDSFYDKKFNGQNWADWEHRYAGKLKSENDAVKAIREMLASLGEPGTVLYSEGDFEDAKQKNVQITSIGLEVEEKAGKILLKPLLKSQAENLGIKEGDELYDVNANPVKARSLDEIAKQLRGDPSTIVEVGILRGASVSRFKLRRLEPNDEVLSTSFIPGGLAYIRPVVMDSPGLVEQFEKVIFDKRAIRGILLDLRSNKGGFLFNAAGMADIIVHKGVIVTTLDCDGYETAKIATARTKYGGKVVVLINTETGGSAEILAGALKYNGAAKFVGVPTTRTQPVIRSINALGRKMGLVVAIAKWQFPNNEVVCIKPDLYVASDAKDRNEWWNKQSKFEPASSTDVQAKAALDLLRKELDTLQD